MSLKNGLAALVVAALLSSTAAAQESLLPLPLEKTSVAAALARSKREHRVLIVVREWKRPPQGRRPWWMNDSVRAWIAWHGVLVELKPDDVEGQQYMRGVPPDPSNTFWGLDVFVDGQHVRLLRCDQMVVPNPLCHGCSPDIATGPDDVADSGKPCVSPTATAVLQQVDFQRWCAAERAPIWAQLHELDCPEPRRPERLYLYAVEKDGIPRTTDLAPPAGGERYADVLSRLTQAQKIVDPARRGERLAAFTWLWERGGELDPAFSLARIGLVLPHLTDLGRSDPAARDRLVRIADSELVLYPWFDDHEEVAYLACVPPAAAATRR